MLLAENKSMTLLLNDPLFSLLPGEEALDKKNLNPVQPQLCVIC